MAALCSALLAPSARAAASLGFNFVSSLGVVLSNKAVFHTAKFTYPTALTAMHYAANYVILLGLRAHGSFESGPVAGSERWLVLSTMAGLLDKYLGRCDPRMRTCRHRGAPGRLRAECLRAEAGAPTLNLFHYLAFQNPGTHKAPEPPR